MNKDRLAAFSDGVLAIIITIMVLELKVPHSAEWSALAETLPIFLSYTLSFVYIAIYWNNHHHLLHAVSRVDGRILWANNNLLFWLSLVPFATAWAGENHFARQPSILFGFALLMPAIAMRLWAEERKTGSIELLLTLPVRLSSVVIGFVPDAGGGTRPSGDGRGGESLSVQGRALIAGAIIGGVRRRRFGRRHLLGRGGRVDFRGRRGGRGLCRRWGI